MSIPSDNSIQSSSSATPPPPPPPPPRDDSVTHTVRKGENLSELSARYRVSPQQLVAANPQLHNPNQLNIGQQINIPVGAHGGTLPAQVQVQKGESLSDIGNKYGVSVQDLSRANGIHNPDMVYPDETVWVPGAGTHGVNPLDAASSGTPDKLSAASPAMDAAVKQYQSAQGSAQQTAARNQLVQAAETEIHTRAQLESPAGQAPDDATLNRYGTEIAQRYGNDAGVQQAVGQAVNNQRAARGVDDALKQLESAQQAQQRAQGNAQPGQSQQLAQNVTAAQNRLKTQIQAEIQTRADTPAGQVPDDATAQKYGDQIAQRYAADPATQKAVNGAMTDLRADLKTQAAIAPAKSESDPQKALAELNDAYAKATPDVQQRILASGDAQAIIGKAASQATGPLGQTKTDGSDFYAQIYALRQSLQNLDQSTAKLDPKLAAAEVTQALPQIEKFNADYASHHDGQSLTSDVLHTGPSTVDAVMSLSGRIAGTAQGDQAVARLAKLGFWDNNSVSNALYGGASAAYPAAVAQQIKASGQDPSNVISIIQQGVQSDQHKVQDDVKQLAEHNRELNWLIQNDGGSMSKAQLQQAIQSYENKDGGKWKADNDKLIQQLTNDGGTLTQNLKTLNTLGQQNPQIADALKLKDTIGSVFNDSSSSYALALAAGKNPQLVNDPQGQSLLDVASTLKLSDQGRKALQTAGSVAIRSKIADSLNGVDWSSPNAASQAKAALDELKSPYYAHLMGVNDDTVWNKAVNAVEESVTGPGADQATVESKLSTLNTSLGKLNAFGSNTIPGQLLRSIGVASAVASLYGSTSKLAAAAQSQNGQAEWFYGVQSAVNSAGLLQKGSELAVGLGAKSPFGNEMATKIFNTFASRTGSGLYNLAGGALDLVDGVRSATGILGGTQDGVSATLSFVSGGGGMLYAASQLAGTSTGEALGLGGVDAAAGATLGLVGVGLVAAATVAKLVYEQSKAAHQYESSSKDFLKAGGYSDSAANALSKQDGLLSGASGASAMPFLEKYGQMKGLSPDQLQKWVNGLSPDQLSSLQKCLLQTAGDSKGDPSQFTNGPPHTTFITDYSSGFSTEITLTNTLGVFEGNLNHDHVPLAHP